MFLSTESSDSLWLWKLFRLVWWQGCTTLLLRFWLRRSGMCGRNVEVVDEVRKKRALVFKMDLGKAYDIEWKPFGLCNWKRKMELDGGDGLRVVWDQQWLEDPEGSFLPLQDWDRMISSFLLILVADLLSRPMKRQKEFRSIEGLSVWREDVKITHLQLSDFNK